MATPGVNTCRQREVLRSVFGGGRGLITYLLLTDQDRVDVLIVTWADFG
jgi:hypothetical protein